MGGGAEQTLSAPKEDLSWAEVGQLGLRYLRIPLALLLVELLYWFLTQPSNTLAWIQTLEAFIWHHASTLIYGAGSTEFAMHQGWWIRVDLLHHNFPDGRVALYVGDECAGIHEMLFITTLVLLTEGVPQRVKIKSIAVLCSLVFVLNIVRLLLLYPFARSGCDADPRGIYCTGEMYDFHHMMFEWGFLLILVGMWTAWFFWAKGPSRITQTDAGKGWRFSRREVWKPVHMGLVVLCLVFFAMAAHSWFGPEAQAAMTQMEDCDSLNEISDRCGSAVRDHDEAISTAWSLGTIGLITLACTMIQVHRTDSSNEAESE